MSMPGTLFYCTKCDFEEGDVRTWGWRESVLESGVRISVDHTFGWCEGCGGLAAVESLSVEGRSAELKGAEQKLADLGGKPTARWWSLNRFVRPARWRKRVENWNYYACSVDDAKDALHMLSVRKNPPRCLKCGSNKIIATILNEKSDQIDGARPARTGFLHPSCGGEL